MESRKRQHRVVSFVERCWPARRHRVLAALAVLAVALAVATLSPTLTRAAYGFFNQSWKLRQVGRYVDPFRTRHALTDSGLPVFDLKISRENHLKIMQTVAAASEAGMLLDEFKQWTPARFIAGGMTYDVKVRVRGDHPHHWEGRRKSWRVRFEGSHPFEGLEELNLIVLSDTKALSEAYTNAVFRRMGMLTHRDGYAVLRLNGVPHGLYYWAEHPTPALLAARRRAEGAVFMRPLANRGLVYKQQVTEEDTLPLRALQALQDYEQDPTEANYAAACAVTDMNDWLSFVAATTLFMSDHSYMLGENHKLYYDTSRGSFYRLPWDIHPRRMPRFHPPLHSQAAIPYELPTVDVFERYVMSQFRARTLVDAELSLHRDRLLWELVRSDALIELYDATFDPLQISCWADVVGSGQEWAFIESGRRVIVNNLRLLREILAERRTALRLRQVGDLVLAGEVTVGNVSGVTITGIDLELDAPLRGNVTLYRDSNRSGAWDASDERLGVATMLDTPTVRWSGLDVTLRPRRVVERDVELQVFDGMPSAPRRVLTCIRSLVTSHELLMVSDTPWPTATQVRLTAHNAVTGEPLVAADLVTSLLVGPAYFDPHQRTATRAAFLRHWPQFVARGDHDVALRAGTHRIDGCVVVPREVNLTLEPGAKIMMGPQASVVCFGAIRAEGDQDAPVVIRAATDAAWGTFASVQAGSTSHLAHVEVSGGGGATVQGIRFTGSIAVHNGAVTLRHCWFGNHPAEDALNIKDGDVEIADCHFEANAHDSLDLDFVRGSVVRTRFERSGGDGLDCSGSRLQVDDVLIEGAQDKGISIGEASTVTVTASTVRGCLIGIAIKDLSEAQIERCRFEDNASTFAAYCKKPIFGGAHARVRACVVTGSSCLSAIDDRSSIEMVDCELPDEGRDCGPPEAFLADPGRQPS